jgi:hypothetical protein
MKIVMIRPWRTLKLPGWVSRIILTSCWLLITFWRNTYHFRYSRWYLRALNVLFPWKNQSSLRLMRIKCFKNFTNQWWMTKEFQRSKNEDLKSLARGKFWKVLKEICWLMRFNNKNE